MNKKFYRYKRFWLLLLLVAYTLVGFFYIPKVIKQQTQQQLAEQLMMQTEMGEVSFNPFTFTTQIKQLKLTDSNQETWFSSAETGINFDPLNLLWGEWKFSDLKLSQPNITFTTDEAGQILIPALPEFPASEETGETMDISIDDIKVNQGRMGIQAGNVKKDFALNIKSLELQHEKFSVLDEDTQFAIKITTEDDETIALDGLYNHAQQQLTGSLQLTDWRATTLNQILPDELLLNNQQGLIHIDGDIKWPLNQKPVLNLAKIEITDVVSDWQQAVRLERFQATLSDVLVDTETQQIHVSNVQSEQGQWQINWPFSTDSKTDQATPTTDTESGWQVSIDNINISQWPINWQDNELAANLPTHIESLRITGFNTQAKAFQLDTTINIAQQGTLTLTSEQSLSPLAVNSQLEINDLALSQLAPWISAHSGLVLTQGELTTTQQISLVGEQFTINGELSATNTAIQNQAGQGIADVGQLNIGATQISSQDKTIVIDQITLDRANGNIIIDEQKNINIQNLKDTPEEAVADSNTEPEWRIKVGAINIKDTSTALIDESIQPPVNTRISELNGHIKGLSSETLSKADVDISGKFNQFSPLSIQGQINPLSSDAYTDLKVIIEDLDLLAFSPYAANYVAFPVNGGKLNVELEYSLNQYELNGKNNLLFKQLKFGDKVNAPDAVDLPLKLAVSLLTDGKGEMKINLPVSGNINDPEFSYGGLVGKAIFKLITSIVASPFKILGALIPNPDPNLSDIQFTTGSAELLPSEQNKLDQIAAIMAQKSELNLQLNPHISQAADTAGLQTIKLLNKAPFSVYDLADPTVTQWLEVQLTPEELATYGTDNGYDYEKIWQALLKQQSVTAVDHNSLTEQRNLAIKNYLIDSADIAAEKVFVEQAQASENSQSMIKIGVSR